MKADTENEFYSILEQEPIENCKHYTQKWPNAIKRQNEKGEIALHITARNPDLHSKVEFLVNEGADVNAVNYWGQTPLHLAAQEKSVENMRILLCAENIELSRKDVNGYTALHYSVSLFQNIDDKWNICLDYLVDAGLGINCTTNIGESVLHHIAKEYDPVAFLSFFKHILSKCPYVNIFLKDFSGKTFLHDKTLPPDFIFEIFEIITQYQCAENVKSLLNQKDCSGNSIWMGLLKYADDTEIKKLVMLYGNTFNSTDNFKNTALHMMSLALKGDDVVDMLIKQGVQVNARNIFGRSALSNVRTNDTFKVFNKYNVELDTRDRWKRTPFFSILSEDTDFPLPFQNMLQQHKDKFEEIDMFGSTPLHVAAYVGNVEKVRFLFECSDKRSILDQMGYTPADIALRFGNFECYQVFCNSTNLYIPPISIKAKSLKGHVDIRELLINFPKDIQGYSQHLLPTKHLSNSKRTENCEDTEVIAEVNDLVSRICDTVTSYDSRFQMSIFQTGSTAEGTKVGPPDEFDFALCMETLGESCDVELPDKTEQTGYVKLKIKETSVSQFISFCDENRFFVALPFLHYLIRYLRRAVNEKDLWTEGNILTKHLNGVSIIGGKAVFNFQTLWNGSKHKHLIISIDLVPVVYKREWWPSFISTKTSKLLTDSVKEAGCFVMLNTKRNDFVLIDVMNDNINFTCNQNSEYDVKQSKNNDHLLLRISVAPTEIALMRSLPEHFQLGYILAKIVKSKYVCPKIHINDIPQYFYDSPLSAFNLEFADCSNDIKSYWLKTCTFFVADQAVLCEKEEKTPIDITKLIYEKLLEFTSSCQFQTFIFPQSDIYALEKNRKMSTYEVRILLLTRKICIDTVLGILGEKFPEDNSEWIRQCEQKYQHVGPLYF